MDAPRKTILVVDDLSEVTHVVTGLLEDEYDVRTAVSGGDALRQMDVLRPPDLVLLDVELGDMSGFDVCTRLKASERTRDIPVIFLTGDTDERSITRGFGLGAADYVSKPFNPWELKARIKNHIRLKDARDKLEALSRKLGKYLSPAVYHTIFEGEKEVKVESAGKLLTVCFTDIVSFSTKAERMDHRGLAEWLNGYLNKMAEITFKYCGTLDKFIGDSVMVFFGDPYSEGKQQDAVNAIMMAREMIEHVPEFGVEIRIGINTGECTVGNFGSDARLDYSIIGREVNVAARLEKNAAPNRILISGSTHELVKDEISCTERGNIRVKGIDRDISTYWVD